MRRRHALGLLAAGLLLPRWGRAAPPALSFESGPGNAGTTWALVGGEVHVGDGTVIGDGVVLVRGARIVAVGARADVPIPAGADTRDAAGKILTPGFIGAQTSIGLSEIDMEEATRDTSRDNEDVVRAAYDVAPAINADNSTIAVQAIEGVTSAAVSATGGLISGRSAFIDLLQGHHRDIVARPRIAMTMNMRQTFAKSRAATLAKLEEVFEDADVYRRRTAAFERRQSRDLAAHRLDLEALGPVLDGTMPVFTAVERASEILAALDLAARRKLRLVLVGATQAWKVADAIAQAQVPVVLRPTDNLPGGLDQLGARLDHAAVLHAAGVRVCIARPGEAHNVRNIRQEAGIAIAYGLDRQAALRAITHEIARAYGMDADYGRIATGLVANLVQWPADPFELSTWPDQVWIRGRPIRMRSRQTELRDRYLDRVTHRR